MIRKLKNIFHLFEAGLSNIYYGFPSKRMFVVGVTGTDGKTTTASIIYHLLHSAGKKVALISTVGACIAGEKYDSGFHVSTPSTWQLQKYIHLAKKKGAEYLVLEVTSHALDQNRVAGIHFDLAVLTNITHEHLDYHATFENYRAAKLKLFKCARKSILNRDDPSFDFFETQLFQKEIISYSLSSDLAHFTPKKFLFKTQLFGEFNIANALAAVAVGHEVGLMDAEIKNALSRFRAPEGRQHIMYDRNFRVMIDFAHTPNAFLQLLPEVRKKTFGRLIHVFGSAGERDKGKRSFMGEAASRYDDVIILTAEDPRSESVENIIDEISAGISQFHVIVASQVSNKNIKFKNDKKYLFKIPDRKQAIDFAISIAKKGDTVLLTGKGHEKSMNYGHGEEQWDEEKIAFVALQKYE